jgi:hypothetical protein
MPHHCFICHHEDGRTFAMRLLVFAFRLEILRRNTRWVERKQLIVIVLNWDLSDLPAHCRQHIANHQTTFVADTHWVRFVFAVKMRTMRAVKSQCMHCVHRSMQTKQWAPYEENPRGNPSFVIDYNGRRSHDCRGTVSARVRFCRRRAARCASMRLSRFTESRSDPYPLRAGARYDPSMTGNLLRWRRESWLYDVTQ